MYGTILMSINLTTLPPGILMDPGIYLIHSSALPNIYLSSCVYEPGFNTDKMILESILLCKSYVFVYY